MTNILPPKSNMKMWLQYEVYEDAKLDMAITLCTMSRTNDQVFVSVRKNRQCKFLHKHDKVNNTKSIRNI